MKLKEFIKEEFADGIKDSHGRYFEVFINPSQSELFSLNKKYGISLRFIIDKKYKRVYVFPAELLHNYVATKYHLPYHERFKPNTPYIYGQGTFQDGKISVSDSYFDEEIKEKFDKAKKTPWAKRFFK